MGIGSISQENHNRLLGLVSNTVRFHGESAPLTVININLTCIGIFDMSVRQVRGDIIMGFLHFHTDMNLAIFNYLRCKE